MSKDAIFTGRVSRTEGTWDMFAWVGDAAPTRIGHGLLNGTEPAWVAKVLEFGVVGGFEEPFWVHLTEDRHIIKFLEGKPNE